MAFGLDQMRALAASEPNWLYFGIVPTDGPRLPFLRNDEVCRRFWATLTLVNICRIDYGD
jgi:hypothetical protein